jgi:hypothetical protein
VAVSDPQIAMHGAVLRKRHTADLPASHSHEGSCALNILYANGDYSQHHIGLSLNVLAYKTETGGVA